MRSYTVLLVRARAASAHAPKLRQVGNSLCPVQAAIHGLRAAAALRFDAVTTRPIQTRDVVAVEPADHY